MRITRAISLRMIVITAVVLAIIIACHFTLDVAVARLAYANNPAQYAILRHLAEAGEGRWWLGGAAIVFVIAACARRHNLARWAALMLISVGASGGLGAALKVLIGKTRPRLLFGEERFGFEPWSFTHEFNSFPSGHASTFGSAAMVLALAFPRARWWLLAVGFVGALTRCAILAHYLSDVLAGFTLGMFIGCVAMRVWRRYFATSAPTASKYFARADAFACANAITDH